VREPRALAGVADDLVQAVLAQRLAPPAALQNDEELVGLGVGGPFARQVRGGRTEEPPRDRDETLVAALAVTDEHPALAGAEVADAQAEHLAAAQAAQHHRLDHGPVTPTPQRGDERVTSAGSSTFGSMRGARTSGTIAPFDWRDRRVLSPFGTGLAATSPVTIR
jgi:hypothetical protein